MVNTAAHRSKIRTYWIVILGTITLLIVISWSQINSVINPLKTNRWFSQQFLGTTYHLFDFGVADLNDDNWLDIYTVNHRARQSLLINDGHGKFTDQLLKLGLSHNSLFPGTEPSDIKPLISEPGLYIYWHKSQLIVKAHHLKTSYSALGSNILGQLQLPESAIIKTRGQFKAPGQKHQGKLTLNLISQGNGQLIIESQKFFFTPNFYLNERLPIDHIYIGAEKLQPISHRFIVDPGRDRHGLAWADFNRDDHTDVFIIHGGGGGKMKTNSLRNNDTLLINEGELFQDQAMRMGIRKETCPGRRVALTDFDGDNQLDIYTGCGRESGIQQFYPNQLHWQNSNGQFTNIATEVGIDISEEGPFIWLDVDNDQDMDLLFAGRDTFFLYTNHNGKFKSQPIGSHAGEVKQLTSADYDRDGDFDIFVASAKANTLLINSNGSYEIVPPQTFDLPNKSIAANWIDYDNDGLIDLHVFPQGIYRQQQGGQFEDTDLLKSKKDGINAVFCTWFDADNDGGQDLVLAINVPDPLWQKLRKLNPFHNRSTSVFTLSKWKLILYRNIGFKNHWLEVEIIGPSGNRPAIGTKIQVETSDKVNRLQQVGQYEGATRSQGHYRMYFGLGNSQKTNTVRIFRSGKLSQKIENLKSDQLLSLKESF